MHYSPGNPDDKRKTISLYLPILILIFCGASPAQERLAVEVAHTFSGQDCASKINAADKYFGANAGEIEVDNECGLSSDTPVRIGGRHVLRFIQGGVYSFSSISMIGMSTVVVGSPASMGSGTTQGAVIIKQRDGANSLLFIRVAGANAVLRDVAIEGNSENNPGTKACVGIENSIRTHLENVTVQNCSGDGIEVKSQHNESVGTKLFHVIALNNHGRGFYCENTTDSFVAQSEFENNLRSGMELFNCGGTRIVACDDGGNGSNAGLAATCPRISEAGSLRDDATRCPGMFLHGKVLKGSPNNNGILITSTQFGNNYGDDLLNYGFDTIANEYVSFAHLINDNYFAGGVNHGRDSFDAIHSSDAGFSAIVGNVVFSGNSETNYRWGIHTQESRNGSNNPDDICANSVHNIMKTIGGSLSVTHNASICSNGAEGKTDLDSRRVRGGP